MHFEQFLMNDENLPLLVYQQSLIYDAKLLLYDFISFNLRLTKQKLYIRVFR